MKGANQFELLLYSRRKQSWGLLLLPLMALSCGWIMLELLHEFPSRSMVFPILLFELVVIHIAIKLSIKLTSDAALVIIRDDALLIQYHKSGTEIQLPFASIAAFQISAYTTLTLQLTFKDGSKRIINDTYHPSRGSAMVKQFEAAFYRYQHGHDQPVPEPSIPAFFKRPLATACLIGLAVALAGLTWLTGIPDGSNGGSFFGGGLI